MQFNEWAITCYELVSILEVMQTSISHTSQETGVPNPVVTALEGYQSLSKLIAHRLQQLAEDLDRADLTTNQSKEQ